MLSLLNNTVNAQQFKTVGKNKYTPIPDHIKEIRELIKKGARFKKIAEQFGITRNTISKINQNETWFDPKWEPVPQPKRTQCKLTPNEVLEIKERIKIEKNMTAIARDYGVKNTTIFNIRKGVTWKDVK